MLISESTIDQVRALPADTAIGYYQTLKPAGGGKFSGLCPFHEDHKEGNFFVYGPTNTYKCFACDAGGDPIQYVMDAQKMDFQEAVLDLANHAGLTVELAANGQSPEAAQAQERHRKLASQALAEAQNLYSREQGPAAAYLLGRGFTKETIELFGLGYAPAGNPVAKLDLPGAEAADLVRQKDGRPYDALRERLTIPLHDRNGRLVGFAGRVLAEKKKTAKYLNPTDTLLYRKGEQLYNMHRATQAIRSAGYAYLVEGYPNVWMACQHGHLNTVATGGTALAKEQIQALKRYTSTVVLVYDGDEAGQKAYARNLKLLLAEGFAVRMVPMPAGRDLAEVLPNPPEGWRPSLAENALDWDQHLASQWADLETRQATITEGVALINTAVDMVLLMPDPTAAALTADRLAKAVKGFGDAYSAKRKEAKPETAGEKPDEVVRVVSREDGTWVMNNRGRHQKVGNYKITLLYQLQIPHTEDCDWILELKRAGQPGETLVMNNRDIISPVAMETAFYAKRFPLDIDAKQGKYLRAYLLEHGLRVAVRVDKLGYDPESGFFFYANQAYDPATKTMKLPNKLDIVDTEEKSYFLPYVNEEKSPKEKIIVRHEPGSIRFEQVAKFVIDHWGRPQVLALAFYVATCFLDLIVKRLRNFPLLFLKGPGGSGKSELAKLLMYFFGRGVGDKLSVGANSSTAAMKEMFASYANICLHLEDYSRATNLGELSDFLILLFDRNFRKTMDQDNRKSVKMMDPLASCVVSSNAPPLEDGSEALASRLIYIQIKQNVREEAAKLAFIREREKLKAESWTEINNYILSFRQLIESQFDNSYKTFVSMFSRHFEAEGLAVNDRVLASYATILSPICLLVTAGHLPNFLGPGSFVDEISQLAIENIKAQYASLVEQSPLQVFWQTVQGLFDDFRAAQQQAAKWVDAEGRSRTANVSYNGYFVYPGSHFQVHPDHKEDGVVVIPEKVLRLSLAAMHGRYEQKLRSSGKVPMSLNQLKDQLRQHQSFDAQHSERKMKFPKLADEPGGDVRLSYILKYRHLAEDFGIDLEY